MNKTAKRIAVIIFAVPVAVFAASMLLPTLAWDGFARVEFRFHVVDARRLRPIEGAKVRVLQYDQLADLADTNMAAVLPSTNTDATGTAVVSVICGAGGSKGILAKTGRFVIAHELAVEAEGYRPLRSPLANIVGGRHWPLSKRAFEVELVLLKNP